MTDSTAEDLLDRQGWVVVPLLEQDEVRALVEFYERHRARPGGINDWGAYDSTYAEFTVIHSRPEFRAAAYREIVRVAGPRVSSLLTPSRPLVANFVNKSPGLGVVPLHQNWAVVDEERFRSVSVWIALSDATVANGTLQVLTGSHRCFREPRGMWSNESLLRVSAAVEPLLEPVAIKAGEAIVLDDALVHFSPPNRTGSDRLAIQLIMTPVASVPRFFQRVGCDGDTALVDVWEVEEQFFWDFWHGEGDARHGRVVDRLRLPGAPWEPAAFLERYYS